VVLGCSPPSSPIRKTKDDELGVARWSSDTKDNRPSLHLLRELFEVRQADRSQSGEYSYSIYSTSTP
jgi:hypothetical protein